MSGAVLPLKKVRGTFLTGLQSARAGFVPSGDKFHTCSLSCIFRQVQAPAKNDFSFFAACGGKLGKALEVYSSAAPGEVRSGVCI